MVSALRIGVSREPAARARHYKRFDNADTR
jgi:hypothetical protein